MSNDKYEAAFYGGYRGTYPGPETWNRALNNPVTPVSPGRPMPDPATTPWAPHDYDGRRNNRGPWLWVILVLALGLVLTLASILIERSGVVPAGVPVIGQDTGIAVCEAMASDKNPAGEVKGQELSLDQVRQVRALFADSRYAEIREPGVKMMDLAAQMAGTVKGDDAGAGALMFMTSFSETYAALSGGCAEHGHEIPSLGA